MTKNILDASAVLAVLNGEPGAAVVLPLLAESALTAVNLAEVVTKLLEAGMTETAAMAAVRGLGIAEIVPFNDVLAWEAARLRLPTKSLGLSLGDRACLALAVQRKLPAVTADKEWAKLTFCKVVVIR
jgi:PIN domain nuclease of toxin-antitoxin system